MGEKGAVVSKQQLSDVRARRGRRLRRLPSVRKRMYMPSGRSSFASRNMMLKKMENNVGARKQPCLLPFERGKLSVRDPLCFTSLTFS